MKGSPRGQLVGVESSQPLGFISGLQTNSNPFLSYSAQESFKTNHNLSTAQLEYFTTQHFVTSDSYDGNIMYRNASHLQKDLCCLRKKTSFYLCLDS